MSSVPFRSAFRIAVVNALLLMSVAACTSQEPSTDNNLDGAKSTPSAAGSDESPPPPRATEPPSSRPTIFIAVNELAKPLLPLAPQLGEVRLSGQCVVFGARGAEATILWPKGTLLEQTGDQLAVRLPSQRAIAIPSKVGLTGAHAPLNSTNMTKFTGRLHPDCPNDVFAVSASQE